MIEGADESMKGDVNPFGESCWEITRLPAADVTPDSVSFLHTQTLEESGNDRSHADQSQHQIVDMLDRALSGEDLLSEVSESDGDCLENETNISLSSSRHSSSDRSHRRSSYRRKSSFGGEIRSNMFASIRKHRMDPEQLAMLVSERNGILFHVYFTSLLSLSFSFLLNQLRKYYEQDKELRRLEADLENIPLPIDFDKLSLSEATDELMKIMEEVERLQDEVPEKSAHNHQADLDHVLLILKNEYNKVESLTTAAADQILPETEEQKAMTASARRIRDKIREIEILKEELRDKLEEVRILEQLPSQSNK